MLLKGFTPGESVIATHTAKVEPWVQMHTPPPPSYSIGGLVADSLGRVDFNAPAPVARIEYTCFGLTSGRVVRCMDSTTRGWPS
jgi:hypothetical protein